MKQSYKIKCSNLSLLSHNIKDENTNNKENTLKYFSFNILISLNEDWKDYYGIYNLKGELNFYLNQVIFGLKLSPSLNNPDLERRLLILTYQHLNKCKHILKNKSNFSQEYLNKK